MVNKINGERGKFVEVISPTTNEKALFNLSTDCIRSVDIDDSPLRKKDSNHQANMAQAMLLTQMGKKEKSQKKMMEILAQQNTDIYPALRICTVPAKSSQGTKTLIFNVHYKNIEELKEDYQTVRELMFS